MTWPIGSIKIVTVTTVIAGPTPERPLMTVVNDAEDGGPLLLRLVTHAFAPRAGQQVQITFSPIPDAPTPGDGAWTITKLITDAPPCTPTQ